MARDTTSSGGTKEHTPPPKASPPVPFTSLFKKMCFNTKYIYYACILSFEHATYWKVCLKFSLCLIHFYFIVSHQSAPFLSGRMSSVAQGHLILLIQPWAQPYQKWSSIGYSNQMCPYHQQDHPWITWVPVTRTATNYRTECLPFNFPKHPSTVEIWVARFSLKHFRYGCFRCCKCSRKNRKLNENWVTIKTQKTGTKHDKNQNNSPMRCLWNPGLWGRAWARATNQMHHAFTGT